MDFPEKPDVPRGTSVREANRNDPFRLEDGRIRCWECGKRAAVVIYEVQAGGKRKKLRVEPCWTCSVQGWNDVPRGTIEKKGDE